MHAIVKIIASLLLAVVSLTTVSAQQIDQRLSDSIAAVDPEIALGLWADDFVDLEEAEAISIDLDNYMTLFFFPGEKEPFVWGPGKTYSLLSLIKTGTLAITRLKDFAPKKKKQKIWNEAGKFKPKASGFYYKVNKK